MKYLVSFGFCLDDVNAQEPTVNYELGFTTRTPNGCNTDIEDPTTEAYYELKRVLLIVVSTGILFNTSLNVHKLQLEERIYPYFFNFLDSYDSYAPSYP